MTPPAIAHARYARLPTLTALSGRCTRPPVRIQFKDDQLEYSRLDFIKLASYDGVKQLLRAGYAYAERTDAAGGFEATLGQRRKWLITRVLETPGRRLGRALSPAFSAV